MITEAPFKSRVLLKDGAWTIPESERPDNWREISEKEYVENSPIAESSAKNVADPKPDSAPFPCPPEKYAALFMPMITGIHAGIVARRELLDLTQYCMELQIAVQKHDERMGGG